jgi:hypothetical protein
VKNMAKLQEGEQIDVNGASVEDVARIPNIGMQSARALIAARPDEGFKGWDQVVELTSGWGTFTVELAEPYCVFGGQTGEHVGGHDQDPDEVGEPEEPQEEPVGPKARRSKRTRAA